MGKSTINIINGHINNSYVSLPAANIHHEIGGWPRARGKQLKSQMCHLMSLLRSLDVKWHLLVYIYIHIYIYNTWATSFLTNNLMGNWTGIFQANDQLFFYSADTPQGASAMVYKRPEPATP